MPSLDRALLAEHASHIRDGVRERMFHLDSGDDRLFAILTEPDDGRRSDLGFVVAHSFGLEVLALRRAERGISRALASAGHPVLFVHRRGFGDSTGDPLETTLDRQLDDLRLAASWLRADAGAARIGAIGCRFGGLLAGILGREGSAERLLLVQPALSGARYARGFVREMQVVRMSDPDGTDRRSLEEMLGDMHRDGALDVLGYAMPAALYDGLGLVDLTQDMGSFAGDALLVQVAKRPTLAKDLGTFRDLVAANGGACETRLVREPAGSTFGSASFVATTADINVRTDVMEPVVDELGRLAAAWVGR
jgi:pimeloyl-ACP methyl ester carboxylesterase